MTFFDGEAGPAMEPRTRASAVGVAEITHQTIRDLLSDYLGDALSQRERAMVDEHLRSCRSCRAFRATLRTTIEAVAGLPHEKAPPAAKRRLHEIHEG